MVMNSGLISLPRIEAFPAGLRVLVVDDDPTWLKILEKMLKKCSYEVTTCGLAREALKLLRDRKDGFDIVISDVNMPDMDGFKLLEHVGLEMDLPVIMMSVDGETRRVMKGVQHGACDYLLKPIRMKELKNIWQHVLRKRMHEVRDIECFDNRNGPDNSNDGQYGGDQTFLKKRKDVENKHDEKGASDPSSKKARVVWTVELHQKFVNAVNQIGIDSDKVGPKKILDLMNVPGLTRENVASHLQKYRLYLCRIRKGDKTESSFGGVKNPDHSPKESNGCFGLQDLIFGQQNDQLPTLTDAKPVDTDAKSRDLLPLTEQRKPFDKIPEVQFETEFKRHPNLEDCFNQSAGPIVQRHAQVDLQDPAPHINSGPSMSESNSLGSLIDINPLNVNQSRNDIRQLSPIEQELEPLPAYPETFACVFEMPLDTKNEYSSESGYDGFKEQVSLERLIQSFPLHSQSHISNSPSLEPHFNVTLDMKSESCSKGSIISAEYEQRNQVLKSEASLELVDEDFLYAWLQGGDGPSKDVGFDYLRFPDFNFPEHIGEDSLPPYVPKSVIDYEYLLDCLEHPFADQGLDLAELFSLLKET